MLNVFGVGRGRKKVSDEGSTADNETLVAPPPVSPGQLRLQKELSTLDLSDHFTLLFPDKNDFMSFVVEVTPDTGIWQRCLFAFRFVVPQTYPYDPPKIKCETAVIHPNIDRNGSVCLDFLRENWKPIYSIEAIIYGLLSLFLEPNCGDPLNKEAAKLVLESPEELSLWHRKQ